MIGKKHDLFILLQASSNSLLTVQSHSSMCTLLHLFYSVHPGSVRFHFIRIRLVAFCSVHPASVRLLCVLMCSLLFWIFYPPWVNFRFVLISSVSFINVHPTSVRYLFVLIPSMPFCSFDHHLVRFLSILIRSLLLLPFQMPSSSQWMNYSELQNAQISAHSRLFVNSLL